MENRSKAIELFLDYLSYYQDNSSRVYSDTPSHKKAWIERKHKIFYNFCVENNIDHVKLSYEYIKKI